MAAQLGPLATPPQLQHLQQHPPPPPFPPPRMPMPMSRPIPMPMPSSSSSSSPSSRPFAFPPPPPTPPSPPPPSASASRYRILRGKSVMTLRPADLSRDSSQLSSTQSQHRLVPTLRKRSKSVTGAEASSQLASSLHPSQLDSDVPPLPTPTLRHRPTNLSLSSSKTQPFRGAKDRLLHRAVSASSTSFRLSPSTSSSSSDSSSLSILSTRSSPHPNLLRRRRRLRRNKKQPRQEEPPPLPPLNLRQHRHDDDPESQLAKHTASSSKSSKPGSAGHSAGPSLSHHPHRRRPTNTTINGIGIHHHHHHDADLDRPLADARRAAEVARRQAQLATPPPKSKRHFLDKFGFLSRGRQSCASSSQPGTPSTAAPTIFSPAPSRASRDSSLDDSPVPLKMGFIEPGGGGIVPQTDVPTSAINGGERRVVVRCLSLTVALPVTAETTAVDILHASAEAASHRIVPATSVVVECYFMLGIERRLRRYERIRDVLNSWDHDRQNSLLILPCESTDQDRDLDLGSVPRGPDPPPGFSFQLHHSSRPGKWNKRWVNLLENGQMYYTKRPDASASDRDSVLLCHLSDFDIYMPRECEMRRTLRPPKKHCYAIKSQQKTVVFPNGENFVHFFCTEEEPLARRFYQLVHGWRSWYLAGRVVDVKRNNKPPQITYNPVTGGDGSPNQVSADEASCSGEEPLMDVNKFKAPEISTLDRALLERRLKEAADRQKVVPEFAPDGLLGNSYDGKRRQADLPGSRSQVGVGVGVGPFTEGPSLLNGVGGPDAGDKSEPKSWFPSAMEHSARLRAYRVRPTEPAMQPRRDRAPAPLLNFSNEACDGPRFRDAQQNYAVRYPGGQPLINFATGGSAACNGPFNGQPPPPPLLHRAPSRRGMTPPPVPPPVSSMPMAPAGTRPRSRSTTATMPATGGGRRMGLDDMPPPVPPLPHRSIRRDRGPGEPPRYPAPRPLEPLVGHAR